MRASPAAPSATTPEVTNMQPITGCWMLSDFLIEKPGLHEWCEKHGWGISWCRTLNAFIATGKTNAAPKRLLKKPGFPKTCDHGTPMKDECQFCYFHTGPMNERMCGGPMAPIFAYWEGHAAYTPRVCQTNKNGDLVYCLR